MPRYSGAFLSFMIIVICLGINITQFPVAREMVDNSFAPYATQNSHEEDSSPEPAKNVLSETLVDPSSGRLSASDPSVTVPSSLVLHQSSPKQSSPKEAAEKKSPEISPQEGPSAPPHGGSPSRISVSPSLVPSLPLVSSNGYEPIPAEKIKPRGVSLASPKESFTQNKAEPKDDEPTAPEIREETEDTEPESTFQLSTPRPAYGEQAGKEETLEPQKEPDTNESQQDSPLPEQVKPLPEVAKPSPSEAGPWSAITVKIRPYDVVEAFRNSPLELDVPFTDETQTNPQDPYADP